MIRAATLADVPAVATMMRRFFEATKWSGMAEWNEGDARALLERLITRDDGALLVLEERDGLAGMVAAVLYGLYFNLGHITCQELFWWVEPERRGKGLALWKAIEDVGRARGAKSFQMSSILRRDRLDRIYKRAGYVPSESTYIKRLI